MVLTLGFILFCLALIMVMGGHEDDWKDMDREDEDAAD